MFRVRHTNTIMKAISPLVLPCWLFLPLLPPPQPPRQSSLRTSSASHHPTTLRESRGKIRAMNSNLSTGEAISEQVFLYSPGREEPSLILMGLAVLTRMVRPKSSDSFWQRKVKEKGEKKKIFKRDAHF